MYSLEYLGTLKSIFFPVAMIDDAIMITLIILRISYIYITLTNGLYDYDYSR